MPELPEVEVLARHLRPLICGQTIRNVAVSREKILRPTSLKNFSETLRGAKFKTLERRGKYLLFTLAKKSKPIALLGHLGMTGRMFLAPKTETLPKHAAVVLDLGARHFVFEDWRYFGRMSLDVSAIENLGPEPWDKKFTAEIFWRELKRSRQAIKVKLLDQSLIAGVGNIYASEALFRAKISPRLASNKLSLVQAGKLLQAVRKVLSDAIAGGSTVQLNFGAGKTDGLFYFGRAADAEDYYEERLHVYDRSGQPCVKCDALIKRIVQAARSTFFCGRCQKD
jgi:formamidopyrimidine-DNA glycosylase